MTVVIVLVLIGIAGQAWHWRRYFELRREMRELEERGRYFEAADAWERRPRERPE